MLMSSGGLLCQVEFVACKGERVSDGDCYRLYQGSCP
jgi:hypothetical protein